MIEMIVLNPGNTKGVNLTPSFFLIFSETRKNFW